MRQNKVETKIQEVLMTRGRVDLSEYFVDLAAVHLKCGVGINLSC